MTRFARTLKYQLNVWNLMRNRVIQSEIARRLHISRQAVNQLVQTIPVKITEALDDAAKLNEVEPKIIDSVRGILLGYSKEFRTDVVIVMHPEADYVYGINTILVDAKYVRARDSVKCFLKTINLLGFSLSAKEKIPDPSSLASFVFSKAFGSDYHLSATETCD